MSKIEVCDSAEAYALGALQGSDLAAFESHLAACESCRRVVADHGAALGRVTASLAMPPADPRLRDQVLDLALAPELPLDLASYAWQEVVPGVRLHVLKEEPARGMRACLVWAKPGARHPRHRHLGDENILVLQGAIRDERGSYGPGQICRSRPGSKHTEEALPGDDCICYVVYYGELERLET